MQHTSTKILVGVVILLSLALLVGNRLGYRWAGGEGYTPSQDFTLIEASGDFRAYTFGEQRVFLNKDAAVEVLNNEQGKETLRFLTGRMVAEGDVRLVVRDVAVTVHGGATLVHYSWLDKLDVLVLEGVADVRQGTYTSTISAGNAVSIDTLTPYDAVAPTTVNIATPNVAPFYDWALQ